MAVQPCMEWIPIKKIKNKDAISALQNLDWYRVFGNKTLHQQVYFLNDILNVFKNIVPSKFIICDDRDQL